MWVCLLNSSNYTTAWVIWCLTPRSQFTRRNLPFCYCFSRGIIIIHFFFSISLSYFGFSSFQFNYSLLLFFTSFRLARLFIGVMNERMQSSTYMHCIFCVSAAVVVFFSLTLFWTVCEKINDEINNITICFFFGKTQKNNRKLQWARERKNDWLRLKSKMQVQIQCMVLYKRTIFIFGLNDIQSRRLLLNSCSRSNGQWWRLKMAYSASLIPFLDRGKKTMYEIQFHRPFWTNQKTKKKWTKSK